MSDPKKENHVPIETQSPRPVVLFGCPFIYIFIDCPLLGGGGGGIPSCQMPEVSILCELTYRGEGGGGYAPMGALQGLDSGPHHEPTYNRG